jgi:hypothetical protein
MNTTASSALVWIGLTYGSDMKKPLPVVPTNGGGGRGEGGGRVGKDGTMTCHPHRVTPMPHRKQGEKNRYGNRSNKGYLVY